MIMTDEGKPSTREEKARRLAESMKRQFGQFCEFLTEPGLVELMLNADGTVWADRLGIGMTRIGTMRRASAESFIGTVVSTLRSTVTRENPLLECALPLEAPFDGSRFEALVPSVVQATVFTIRRVIMVEAGQCPPRARMRGRGASLHSLSASHGQRQSWPRQHFVLIFSLAAAELATGHSTTAITYKVAIPAQPPTSKLSPPSYRSASPVSTPHQMHIKVSGMMWTFLSITELIPYNYEVRAL
jgi:hypothetical protein